MSRGLGDVYKRQGFCGPKITDILAAELGMDVWQITKSGPGSEILIGKTKTGTAREER